MSCFTQGNRVDFTLPITRGQVDADVYYSLPTTRGRVNADVYYWRGLARRRQGNWTGAEADYSEAIRLDPRFAWAYNSRAWLWATCPDDKYRDGKRAVESATRACKLTKWKGAFPLGTLAAAYAESGDFDAAVKCQEKAQAMYPDDKDREKGLARLELYKAHRPYCEGPEASGAEADYSEAIRLDPKYAEAYYIRGRAWGNKGEYDRAIADYNEAIRLDPKSTWAYNNRAWLWATCPDDIYRDGKRAVESATRACKLTKWKEAFSLGTLAAAYAESGDFDAAVKCQEKAQAMYPDDKYREKGLARLELYKAHRPYRGGPADYL